MKVINKRIEMRNYIRKLRFLLAILIGMNFPTESHCQAERNVQVRPLTVGDTIDLSSITGFDNHQIKEIKTKHVIIDFWATWCFACLNGMPRLSDLQKKFANQLEIFYVTYENDSLVNNIYKKNLIPKEIEPNIITNDKLLKRHFPYLTLPHEVWINNKGIVVAITGGSEISEENIQKFLANEELRLPVKRENFNYEKEGLSNADSDDVLYRSILSKYNPNAPHRGMFDRGAPSFSTDSTKYKTVNRAFFSNYPVIRLYYCIYMLWKNKGDGNVNPYRVEVNIKDDSIRRLYADVNTKIPFFPDLPFRKWKTRQEYNKDNLYSYELKLREFVPDTLVYQYMFDDFNRFFPIKGEIVKRNIECLVLYVKDTTKVAGSLIYKDGDQNAVITTEKIIMRKWNMRHLVKNLNMFRAKPFINETNISEPIDIVIDFSKSPFLDRKQGKVVNMLTFDEDIFESEMAKYGLGVKKEKRVIDVLSITD